MIHNPLKLYELKRSNEVTILREEEGLCRLGQKEKKKKMK
jgi:hypothetical protein